MIALASDHAGFALKNELKKYITEELGYECKDYGTYRRKQLQLPRIRLQSRKGRSGRRMRKGHSCLRHGRGHIHFRKQGQGDKMRGLQRTLFGKTIPQPQQHQYAGNGQQSGGQRTCQNDCQNVARSRV